MTLRLGIIGYSEGNGHPYSWSAICNGYSTKYMMNCEFPVILEYLKLQEWPKAKITGAKVTHIWTQNVKLSKRIAQASLIETVVLNPLEMINNIDALLLARDDTQNHYKNAKPFLDAGIPVYIDKPVALSVEQLDKLWNAQKYNGQLFTCSALRFAKEFQLDPNLKHQIGKINHIQAITSKSWEKYAVHIIEPTINMIGSFLDFSSVKTQVIGSKGRSVYLRFANDVTVDFIALGDGTPGPISVTVFGEQGWHEFKLIDTFSAFKNALEIFLLSVRSKTCQSPYTFNQKVVSIIEAGVLNYE